MKDKDKDIFYIAGRVDISEWDWKKEFANLAKALRKHPAAMINFDIGKIMGIVSALDSTQQELNKERKKLDLYRAELLKYQNDKR